MSCVSQDGSLCVYVHTHTHHVAALRLAKLQSSICWWNSGETILQAQKFIPIRLVFDSFLLEMQLLQILIINMNEGDGCLSIIFQVSAASCLPGFSSGWGQKSQPNSEEPRWFKSASDNLLCSHSGEPVEIRAEDRARRGYVCFELIQKWRLPSYQEF